ncbi:MAG TPA: hypothetical protein VJT54_00505 [Verrucomicrobiae bacterium]|nr:hypothetical protein [Verrucomicrobiae bacterium]
MKTNLHNSVIWLGGGVLVAGLLPLLLYWLLLGHVPAWTDLLNGQVTVFRDTSRFEQWLVIVTAFGIKPAYTLLSLVVILWLWRQRGPDLAALRWGLIAFWLGENACAVNYMIFHGYSDSWEYLHNLGMAVCFSFATYALLEGVDRRLIKYSSARDRCAALSLCRACIKYDSTAPCGLRRVFTLLLPATLMVAAMPLSADLKTTAYDTVILGSNVHYSETLADQLFEIRYCPYLAVLLLTASWLVLLFKREEPVPLAKALFAAGMGPVGFGFLRLFLAAAYRDDPVWFNAWEEITELLFVAAVAFILLVFRHSLFVKEPPVQTWPTTM